MNFVQRLRRVIALVTTAGVVLGGANQTSATGAPATHAAQADSPAEPVPGWAATWIGRPTESVRARHGAQNPAPLLRREFSVSGNIIKARLKIVGLGFYEAHINGQRVGDHFLDPPPSQYNKTAFSRTFDVTSLVKSGDNAIGVELGRSYFASPAPPAGFDLGDVLFGLSEAEWWEEPRLLARLQLTMQDGSKHVVVSDDQWKIADGPRRDSLYYGEIFDAREAIEGWTLPSFDDADWASAPEQPAPTTRIIPAKMPPVKVIRTLKPRSQTRPDPGTTVYDFGRPMGGWARISVSGVAGTTVTLRYGEQLDAAGRVIDTILGDHVDSYTLDGSGTERWEPSFTRHGFRYVQVETPAPLTELAIEARLAHTALESTGHFATDSVLLNRIHRNQLNSLLDNLYGIPTDTPWRDRQGWTADAYLFFRGAAMNFDVDSFYDRWLTSFRDAQMPDGGLPPIVPNSGMTQLDSYSHDPSWGGTFILDVWEHYQQYGRSAVLRDNYDAVRRYLTLQARTVSTTGYIFEGTSFGDWASPGAEQNPGGNLAAPEGPMLTATGDLYQEFRTAEAIAKRLEKHADAARYGKLALRIAAAFNKRFFDWSTNTYHTDEQDAGYRQTSNVLPLAYGLVPKSRVSAVLDNLVKDIKGRGTDLNTGSIGTKLLLPTLTHLGRGNLAYKLAIQTDYPSWGNWVKQGARTSWETWATDSPILSRNHPFLGTIEDWFYGDLAGIRPATPGYRRILIKPTFPQGLEAASATVGTPRGKVVSSWRRTSDGVTLQVQVPPFVPAAVHMPATNGGHRVYRFRGGTHTFH